MPTFKPPIPLADRVSLQGRTALVTGASRGIGAAVAASLAAAGARVALSGRNADDLAKVAGNLPGDPIVLIADLADPAAPSRLADEATQALGRVDILVNNAGVFRGAGPAQLLSTAMIDEVLAVNVRAALILAGSLGDRMATNGGGTIVNVGSIMASVTTAYAALYVASKGAIDGMTRALAAELGPRGVRVNSVRPGLVDTEMGAFLISDEAAHAHYRSQTPLGRVADAQDVADLVTFLVGPAAAYIHGEDIVIDGGWGNTRQLLPAA